MKPIIHSVGCLNHPNIRTWDPDDPNYIAETLTLSIGPKGEKQADTFTMLLATPRGLSGLPSQGGITATRPLLVVDRYDFQSLWAWLQKTVATCEGETWLDCVGELRRYFSWEHEPQGASIMRGMDPDVKSVGSWDHPNIATWEPDDPSEAAEELMVDIGMRGKRQADTFTIRVATPKGLSRLRAKDGIVAVAPLVVMGRYDFQLLWAWLEKIVSTCEGATWMDCVKNLRVYFLWEYEGMSPDIA